MAAHASAKSPICDSAIVCESRDYSLMTLSLNETNHVQELEAVGIKRRDVLQV